MLPSSLELEDHQPTDTDVPQRWAFGAPLSPAGLAQGQTRGQSRAAELGTLRPRQHTCVTPPPPAPPTPRPPPPYPTAPRPRPPCRNGSPASSATPSADWPPSSRHALPRPRRAPAAGQRLPRALFWVGPAVLSGVSVGAAATAF